LGKIREVDDFLGNTTDARQTLRESHPEVMFAALNGGRPMTHTKKTADGFKERLALLSDLFDDSESVVSKVRARYLKREVADDDILDALILATGAERCVRLGIRTLPTESEMDTHGLRMEMVYV